MRQTLLISMLIIALAPVTASGQATREAFAYALGRAVTAEKYCGMPGEVEKAKQWVSSFRSGFDTYNNQEDAFLLFSIGGRIEAQRAKMGTHPWCVEYRAANHLIGF
jgi:hypothetical protein